MNNSEFRNLLHTGGTASKDGSPQDRSAAASSKSSLGSRSRTSMPMTPRSVIGRSGNNAFAKQSSEHAKSSNDGPPAKRFKSAAAPRGTRLAQGYSDRTTSRQDEEQDGKVKKLKELEQMVKDEKIDRATFDRLREQMGIGGDLSTTHLVKGLDFKLLERARQGEDLNKSQKEPQEVEEDAGDLDEALDDALQKDVGAREREEAHDDPVQEEASQVPLSRDEILRMLKESRNAPKKAAPEPALGDRFRKLESTEKPGKKKFVESVNGRRREVLLITQADGSTKRKSRWLDPEPEAQKAPKPLGMEVPAEMLAKQKALEAAAAAEDEDDDIFQGVGADYDPLADIDSEDEEHGTKQKQDSMDPDAPAKRNYFRGADQDDSEDRDKSKKRDATLMAAFQKAAAMRNEEPARSDPDTSAHQSDKSKAFLEKLKAEEQADRRDMDLGFSGDSRYDDDDEDGPIYEEGDNEDKPKRKRGGKKRKGDKDNVADVMSVLEGRKK